MTYDILYWFSVLSYLFVPVFGLVEMLIDRKYQETTSKVAKLKWELYRIDKVRVNYPTDVVFGYKIPKVFTKNTSEKPELDWEMIKNPVWSLLVVAPVITIIGIYTITIKVVIGRKYTFFGLIGIFFKLYYDKLEKLEWSKELLDELESEKKERINARRFIYGEQYPEFETEVV